MYLFQKIYYSCGIVIILSLCFPSRIPKQLVFYYLPCSFYWERPCFKWSVTLDMYIIGEIKTGILFKDFYICTTYRKRQKFELISYCFFVPHADFQVILGKKIYIHFVFKVAYFDPPWDARKKRRIIYFCGVTRKKTFVARRMHFWNIFLKTFWPKMGFTWLRIYKDFKPSSGNFLMKLCARLLYYSRTFLRIGNQHRFSICGWPTFEFKNADSDY